jgi:hypothetical protein
MSASHRLSERQRLDNERWRHDWEITLAQTFKAHGHGWAESLRLARSHFDQKMSRRMGGNGGPVLDDWA